MLFDTLFGLKISTNHEMHSKFYLNLKLKHFPLIALHKLRSFREAKTSDKIRDKAPVLIEQRLTPPPDEIYSLHRKLGGVFLLCRKLRANIEVRSAFMEQYEQYKFTT